MQEERASEDLSLIVEEKESCFGCGHMSFLAEHPEISNEGNACTSREPSFASPLKSAKAPEGSDRLCLGTRLRSIQLALW